MNDYITPAAEIRILYDPKVAPLERPKISTSKDASLIFRQVFDVSQLNIREEAAVLYLNRANRVLGAYKVSSGGITGTVVDPRLILSVALKCLACGIVIAHTHPSGELKPSKADMDLTQKLQEGARLFDICLLDHLILTTESYLSMADEGFI